MALGIFLEFRRLKSLIVTAIRPCVCGVYSRYAVPDLLRLWVPVRGLLYPRRYVRGNHDGDVLLPAL